MSHQPSIPPPKEPPTCGNCRFWRNGECHESSPQRVAYVIHGVVAGNAFASEIVESPTRWPETPASQWCGKWRAPDPAPRPQEPVKIGQGGRR